VRFWMSISTFGGSVKNNPNLVKPKNFLAVPDMAIFLPEMAFISAKYYSIMRQELLASVKMSFEEIEKARIQPERKEPVIHPIKQADWFRSRYQECR
jgi:hypothetical protein